MYSPCAVVNEFRMTSLDTRENFLKTRSTFPPFLFPHVGHFFAIYFLESEKSGSYEVT